MCMKSAACAGSRCSASPPHRANHFPPLLLLRQRHRGRGRKVDASLARSGKALEYAPPPPWVCLKMAAVVSNKQARERLGE